ncbi:MAG: hypothetical protein FWE77_04275 [Clostridia bacterium]|nr:hypothetical protein [Clostridia bacterium]
MTLYRDEPVLGTLAGRLVPPDNRYPDCRCELLLTELRLYVLEDNYDGTYTEHITLPIESVLRIDRWSQVISDSGIESVAVEPRGWQRFWYRFAGPIAVARRNPERVRSANEYARVLYRAQDGRETSIYLSEAGNPHSLAQKLEKYRVRAGLDYQSPFA